MWPVALLARRAVGNVSVTPVGFGLLSRQQVQAEEEAPQNRGGRRRLHVGPGNPAEINNLRQQGRDVGHQREERKNVPSRHKFLQAYHQQGTTIDHKTT